MRCFVMDENRIASLAREIINRNKGASLVTGFVAQCDVLLFLVALYFFPGGSPVVAQKKKGLTVLPVSPYNYWSG